jgi:small subunit ribosomal protein S3e
MKGWDPEGNIGPKKPLPDSVQIIEPREEKQINEPTSEQREPVAAVPPPAEEFSAPEPAAYPEAEAQQPVF